MLQDLCEKTCPGEQQDSTSCLTTFPSPYVLLHYDFSRSRFCADNHIQHLAFSPEFTAAVEAKQVAQQEAQRAAFVVDKARQEKQATVVRAQGEARSAELIGDAIKKSRSYVDLRQIENARNIATILQEAGGKNKLYLDSNGLGLNVGASNEDFKKHSP